ncbi:MAG: NAD(P)/FAD-dependent oxidoreductase [Oceanicaulis sp.]
MRAAVIGAGLAGAAAARALKAAGVEPVLFDKGRGPGGRLSTRRAETPLGEVRVDHGAQFVTAQSESFERFLRQAAREGAAALWTGRLVSVDRYANVEPMRKKARYVGAPGMNALVRAGLAGFEPQFSRRVLKLAGGAGAWTVVFEDGSREGPFERIALTLPPEQLIDCLARSQGDFPDIITAAHQVEITPCWTVMALLETPFDPGFDGAQIYGGGIRWMARMASRPGRDSAEAVVIQASPDWSAGFMEEDPGAVARMLCEEAFVRFNMPEPVWSAAHRWRYALVKTAAGSPFILDETGTVGAGGDWRLGGRAEYAWLSGEALGAALANGR